MLSNLLHAYITVEVPSGMMPVGGSLADGHVLEPFDDHVLDEVEGALAGGKSCLIDFVELQSTEQELDRCSGEAVRA